MARPERKKLQRRFYLSLTDRQRERERDQREKKKLRLWKEPGRKKRFKQEDGGENVKEEWILRGFIRKHCRNV